ncbi:Uncharacterised protein g9786 [Pycnogonum litorale]
MGAKLIVEMSGSQTIITNPEDKSEKKFAFDYCYWSNDGGKPDAKGYVIADPSHPNSSKFCDQKRVYDDMGKGILKNAWDGYNATLFAYGQTGSGKSWSVIGDNVNKGIVPSFCEEMFQNIDQKKKNESTDFEVRFNMLEIYNEVVRDLLNPSKNKSGLKVRQHPKKGFYAEGLKSCLVTTYSGIEAKLEEGTLNRTIASTNMNATSSRAHTIVGITLIQKKKNSQGNETTKSATVNLVDLAGSERVQSTGATGDQLKEGAKINQSLSCLGNCIHALAERVTKKNVKIPFRDSALTKLLMNALSGNSKTVMIAAISPADVNYDESLSTLRYADRAKQIRTVAVINEDKTEKLIRELTEENEKLKRQMGDKTIIDPSAEAKMSPAEIATMRKSIEEELAAQMAENEREMVEMRQTLEEKLKMADQVPGDAMKKKEERNKYPHLTNINFDTQLTDKIVHIIRPGENTVGKDPNCNVQLQGPSIQESHALIEFHDNGGVSVEKVGDSKIVLNGDPVSTRVLLSDGDWMLFGSTQWYAYYNPKQKKKGRKVTWEMAQEEIANKSGLIEASGDGKSPESALLQQDLFDVLPSVGVANAISADLDKKVKFDIMLLDPVMLGQSSGRTQVFVTIRNLETGQEVTWSKEKFINRLYLMKEIFQKYEDGEDWHVPKERDPFLDDSDDSPFGFVVFSLEALSYKMDMKEQLSITNYRGSEIGVLELEVTPCDSQGKVYSNIDDEFVDNPMDLVGKDLHFRVNIKCCRGLPGRYTEYWCKFKIYNDKQDNETERKDGTTNPDFNYSKLFSYKPVTRKLIEYMKCTTVVIQVYGKSKAIKLGEQRTNKKSTKQMIAEDILDKNNLMNGFRMNGRDAVKRCIQKSEQMQKKAVSINVLKELLECGSAESVEKILESPSFLQASESDDEDEKLSQNSSSACTLL